MAIRVGDILKSASIVLNDEGFVRWTQAELFLWVNEAAGDLVIRRPAARALTAPLTLVAGTAQALPEGGVILLDIVRNIGAAGQPGYPVRRADRHLIDDQFPGWHASKPRAVVKNYMFDEATPTTFYVWPPVLAGTKVEAVYSMAPALVQSPDDMLPFDRIYIGPLTSYVLYRSYAKDSEYANAAMASAHFAAYTEALGAQNTVTNEASPNTRS
jgi:hypothetical protein